MNNNPSVRKESRSSGFAACLWMLFISLILFCVSVFNSFIGGVVDGKKAGNVKRAFLASILPALSISIIIVVISGAIVGGILS